METSRQVKTGMWPRLRAHFTTRSRGNYGSRLGIFLFLLPGMGLYGALMLYPTFLSIYYSFLDWSGGPVFQAPFVGFDNFIAVSRDPLLFNAFLVNLRQLALNWFFQIPVALLLAFVVSQLRSGPIYKFIFFVPVIIPAATMALMWRFMLSGSAYGLVNSALTSMGLGQYAPRWLSANGLVQWVVTFPEAWTRIGYYMVIFLAALTTVSRELYEAIEIDGGDWRHKLFYVTLPSIRGVYVICMIFSAHSAFGQYIYPYLMTHGGPINSSHTLISYALYLLWEKKEWGYGNAVATITLILSLVVAGLAWRLRRRKAS